MTQPPAPDAAAEATGQAAPNEAELAKEAGQWLAAIERAARFRNTWFQEGRKIVDEYRSSGKGRTTRAKKRYNLFWSNVETQRPALYGQQPQPAVARLFYDKDPIARLASLILERLLIVQMALYDFDDMMKAAVKDLTLPGLGQAWIEYYPEFGPDKPTEDGKGTIPGDKIGEKVCARYVQWDAYLEGPAKRWEDVPWVAKEEPMTQEEVETLLTGLLGDAAKAKVAAAALTYDEVDPGDKKGEYTTEGAASAGGKKTVIYDIWDKASRNQIILAKQSKKILAKRPDPLQLKDFFPCPRPLMATTTNDSRLPVPDYEEYKGQLQELDEISERIRLLTKALKLTGIYNGGGKTDLNQIFTLQDNQMLKVDAWAVFAEKGGLRGNMEFLPIEEVQRVVTALIQAREVLKANIAELTGLADLQRGQTNPNETLGAQQLKAQYGNRRMADRQQEVARFARDILRLKAEVISEHFSATTLYEASGAQFMPEAVKQLPAPPLPLQPGQPVPPPQVVPGPNFEQAVQLLRSDKQRAFRVDVETDSTIAPDENAEKQRVNELLTAVGTFLPVAIDATAKAPELKPVVGELLLLAVRKYRAGRTVEAKLEQMVDQMNQPQPPAPDPEQVKAEQELALKKKQAEGELAIKQEETRGNLMIKREEMQGNLQLKQQENQLDAAAKAMQPQVMVANASQQ